MLEYEWYNWLGLFLVIYNLSIELGIWTKTIKFKLSIVGRLHSKLWFNPLLITIGLFLMYLNRY